MYGFTKAISYAVAGVIALASSVSDHSHKCEGFVEENDLYISVDQAPLRMNNFAANPTQAGGITEAEFNTVIDRVGAYYAPVVAAKGGTLVVNKNWADGTVNAYANRQGNNWYISMFGGLARHETISQDGMALVVCHELGHHIGGAPKIGGFFNTWATNEGGSDYFASLKCFRSVYKMDNNEEILKGVMVPEIAVKTCGAQFTDKADQLVCQRASLAGISVSMLFKVLRKETVDPKLDTPDMKAVTKTNDQHPGTQCRADTYYAGASCNALVTDQQDDKNYKMGSCVEGTSTAGVRPRCWFAAPQTLDFN